MEEQDWKNIIDELTEQLGQISLEKAVARADIKKALNIIEEQKKEIEKLQAENNSLNSAEIHNITTKE